MRRSERDSELTQSSSEIINSHILCFFVLFWFHIFHVFRFFVLFLFCDGVSLCNYPDCPETHFVE